MQFLKIVILLYTVDNDTVVETSWRFRKMSKDQTPIIDIKTIKLGKDMEKKIKKGGKRPK